MTKAFMVRCVGPDTIRFCGVLADTAIAAKAAARTVYPAADSYEPEETVLSDETIRDYGLTPGGGARIF
ncbi:MAG TPA: hypothetical protein VHY35_12665 [Stellaceae bacterium]|nr:hypothetical protein [Stellaceae bacterium]